MAREEADREDLLAEATALVERAAWAASDATGSSAARPDVTRRNSARPEVAAAPRNAQANAADPVVVGFRRDGSASVYFGADAAYHFNASSALRRAFADGLLYRAERGQLIELRRERTPDETVLHARPLSPAERAALLAALRARLETLAAMLADGRLLLTGHVPANADVPGRVLQWLTSLPPEIAVGDSPRAG